MNLKPLKRISMFTRGEVREVSVVETTAYRSQPGPGAQYTAFTAAIDWRNEGIWSAMLAPIRQLIFGYAAERIPVLYCLQAVSQ